MTVSLLLLMSYGMVGETAHEWIGVVMLVLFLLHHIWNKHWSRSLFKGKYTAIRILQTILVILILLCMLGSMFSGIILSRHVFAFLTIRGLNSFARNQHMICAYWGFVLMSLHLGFHWNRMIGMARKRLKSSAHIFTWTLRLLAVLLAGYGIYAFIQRGIGRYMLLLDQYVFFDYTEPLILFVMDYVAVMGLFVFVGHYLSKALIYS